MTNFLDTEDIAKHFKVDKRTVQRWMKVHEMPFYKMGGIVRFDLEESNKWFKEKFKV